MKERLQGWLVLVAVITMAWVGCQHVQRRVTAASRPYTAHIQSLWESHQVRQWRDTTEVVQKYNVRVNYNWGELDRAAYCQLRVGDSVTVVSYDSLYIHGRFIGRLWRIIYPARIEE